MALLVKPDSDSEPVVVLDDAEAESMDFPGMDTAAVAYLQALGITSPATWLAFRLGIPGDASLARLGLVGRKRPQAAGISIPAWLPSDPSHVVGLVRVTTAQRIHRFATSPPAGIAGPPSLATAEHIVLADNPILALKLHQAGANKGNVGLVEDPAVIPPLLEWLASREVVLVSYRPKQLHALRAAFGERGPSLPGHVLGKL